MLSIATVFVGLWIVVVLASPTPIGCALRRWMVERPAALLLRITPGLVLLVLLLVTGAATIGLTLGHEGVRLIAMGLPELATWITMFEVTAYLDALAAVVAAASIVRVRGLKAWLYTLAARRSPRPRSRRRAARVNRRPPANDDERPAVAVAA